MVKYTPTRIRMKKKDLYRKVVMQTISEEDNNDIMDDGFTLTCKSRALETTRMTTII